MRAARLLLCVLISLPLCAQLHPNLERGFNAEKMYDFSAVDSVNMFNGNMTLHIPLGSELRANGVLPYQLSLSYNSLFWEYLQVPANAPEDPDELQAVPTKHSNAGAGWIATLGRLIDPSEFAGNDDHAWMVVSPDGAEHALHPALHDEATDGVHQYTRDGSYARFTPVSTHVSTVELADGTTQTFTELQPQAGIWATATTTTHKWRLTSIADRFGNSVTIGYSQSVTGANPYYTEIWTITDGPRTTTAFFRKDSDLAPGTSTFDAMLDHVVVPAFGGTTATYQLHYSAHVIPPGAGDDVTSGTLSVAMLDSVTLPSGHTYTMVYDNSLSSATPGVLRQLTLPTGGTVEWTYQTSDWPADSWHRHQSTSTPIPPVVSSRLFGGGSWTYARYPGSVSCTTAGNHTWGGNRQLTAWVTGPDGVTSLSYYSVFVPGSNLRPHSDTCLGAEVWDAAAYGLPFTPSDGSYAVPGSSVSSSLNGDSAVLNSPSDLARYLSTEVRTSFVAPFDASWHGFGQLPGHGTRLRSTWVTYEHDAFDTSAAKHDVNPRTTSSLTRYEDDASCGGQVCYSGERLFGFDNYGHFRQSSSLGNFSGSANFRTTFTSYDTSLDSQSHWVLGTYGEQCSVDQTSQKTSLLSACSDVLTAAVTKVNIDRATGALLARRTAAVNLSSGATTPTHDLLAVFEYDSGDHGLVSREKYYGGDLTPLSSSSGFTTTSQPDYWIDHTYAFASGALTRVQSGYHGHSFLFEDADLDPATGHVSSFRDAAGLATTFGWDAMGRLSEVNPPGTQKTSYTYSAGGVTPVTVDTETASGDTNSGKLAGRYEYDAWGRLATTRTRAWDGVWSSVTATYDALGRKTAVTTPTRPGQAAFWTTTSYDSFGRPTSITAPDGTVTTFARTGVTTTARTAGIAQTLNHADENATTTEYSDRLGRLIRVDEPSGTNSASTSTFYGYDVGDRLISVSTGIQPRSFAYDGRGLLVSETHPERGTTAYILGSNDGTPDGYDARGHARRRLMGNTFGPFDLTFTYDSAERLTAVSDFDPASSATPRPQRALKEFSYATSNSPANCAETTTGNCDARSGKLLTAKRHNRTSALGDVTVTETYAYHGRGGRPSSRDTAVMSSFPYLDRTFHFSQSFNDVGLVASTTYPAECFIGDCAGMLGSSITVPNTYRNGFLSAVGDYIDGITYAANGLVSTIQHHNGTTEGWTADPHGMARPCSIYLTRPGIAQNTAVNDPCSNQQALWSSGTYSYDGAGNIKAIDQSSYTYDGVGRLKSAGNAETFSYDIYGNMTAHTGNSTAVDANTNHLSTGATYDAAGSLSTWDDPADASTRTLHYEWDAAGSLLRMHDENTAASNPLLHDAPRGTVNNYYIYTADDERLATLALPLGQFTAFPFINFTYTLRGFGNELLSTFSVGASTPTSGITLNWQEDDIWRGAHLCAISTPAGRRYTTLDHLGSPRVFTDSNATILAQPTFAPFGTGGTTGTTALQFTGHERDTYANGESIDYMHARYYRAGWGRFLSVDPSLDMKMAMANPQAWNRYAYVRNNPLRFIDPDGRLDYDAILLDRKLHVHIDDRLPMAQQKALQGQVNAGLATLNDNKGKLTASQMRIIGNIKTVSVMNLRPGLRSGVQASSGKLTFTTQYVQGSSAAWLGSALAHDGEHVEIAKTINRDSMVLGAIGEEKKALQFQLGVGRKTGLSGDEVHYLQDLIKNPEQLRSYVLQPGPGN
jgi:RHS repeat-associated protein